MATMDSQVESIDFGHTLDGSGAAGQEESIPRSFLAGADMLALTLAFIVSGSLAPVVQWLLLPSGPVGLSLPVWMSLPKEPGAFPSVASLTWVLVATLAPTVLFMDLLGGYRSLVDQSRARLGLSCVFAPLLGLSCLTLALFAFKIPSASRVFVFTFGVGSSLSLLAYRTNLRLYKRRRLNAGLYAKNLLLIGRPAAIAWVGHHIAQTVSPTRHKITGWLHAPASPVEDVPELLRTPSTPRVAPLGSVDQLRDLLVHRPVHEIVAVQSAGGQQWLREVIDVSHDFRVRLRIVPEALLISTPYDRRFVFRSEPLRLPEIVLEPLNLESEALFVKRLIDILVSAALLALLAPLLIVIAIAIKLTTPRLPILYPWRVIGLKGRAFTGYKFTTMQADADERKNDLLARNEMHGPVFKIASDPRTTKLGRILRKYSFNELPQLWSVLKGDMSLVGPRPAFRHELDRYELWHKRKLCVKPGITCLWQISGRNRISNFDDWVRLDLQYIDQWSLWLDFRILMRTLWVVISGSGS